MPTLHVVDASRYQIERPDPLDLARAQSAGIGAVNIGISGGGYVRAAADRIRYADRARVLGLGISTYHFLTAGSGVLQANTAYGRMIEIGGPDGMAHAVDCEADANEQTLREYVTTMVRHLGRPISIYTGKWWLDSRGWRVNDLSPYLWAAPSAGYLGGYPGDTSPHWTVNYGGYSTLAAMQYAVTPLPFTGPCSLSAIRDPAVWTALTGRRPGMRAPNMQKLTGQVKGWRPGVVIYGVGDEAHKLSPSDHNEDDTPGSKAEQEDADNIPEHRAIDVMLGPAFSKADGDQLVSWLVTRPANRARLKYVIWYGGIWRRATGWVREVYTGSDKHMNHPHVSGLAADDENTRDWELEGDDMALDPNSAHDNALMFRAAALVNMSPKVGGTAVPNEVNKLAEAIDAIRAAQSAPVPVQVDAAAVAAALKADASFLAAIAKAVNDDAAKRGAE
jgi:hypothetical protein